MEPREHDAVSTTVDGDYFLRSPLQPSGSRPRECVKGSEESRKPRLLFCGDKENTNVNIIEDDTFSLQPQQMKRKKKGGGGFNLRKSIAWNRAFLTGEGVLNSQELSMVTGNVSSSRSSSVVHEETDSFSDLANVQELEENLFRASPREDRIVCGSPLPKHVSPATDNASPGSAGRRKVLSSGDTNRSGSKRSCCSQPVSSFPLKRPANVNIVKSTTKERKVSKSPVPKPVPCALFKTSKLITVAHPFDLNNTKAGPSNAKLDHTGKSKPAKSCTPPARRNMVSLVKSSPTTSPRPSVIKSKRTLPFTGHTLHVRGERSKKTAVSEKMISKQERPCSDHASYRNRKLAAALPLTSANLAKNSTFSGPEPCRVPHLEQGSSVGKMENLCNDGIVMENNAVQFSSSGSAQSTDKPVASDEVDSVSLRGHMQVELNEPSISKEHMPSTPVQEEQISIAQAGPSIAEEISHMECVKLPSSDESSIIVSSEREDIQSHNSMKDADPSLEVQNCSAVCEIQAKVYSFLPYLVTLSLCFLPHLNKF